MAPGGPLRSRARVRISRIRTAPGVSPSAAAASFGRSPAISTSSITARSRSGSMASADQVPAGSFGIDPVEQFLDLVRVQVASAGQPLQLVLLQAVASQYEA